MNIEKWDGPIDDYPRQFAEQWQPLSEMLSAAAETLCQAAGGISNTSAERRAVLAAHGEMMLESVETLKASSADFVLRLLALESTLKELRTR